MTYTGRGGKPGVPGRDGVTGKEGLPGLPGKQVSDQRPLTFTETYALIS